MKAIVGNEGRIILHLFGKREDIHAGKPSLLGFRPDDGVELVNALRNVAAARIRLSLRRNAKIWNGDKEDLLDICLLDMIEYVLQFFLEDFLAYAAHPIVHADQ